MCPQQGDAIARGQFWNGGNLTPAALDSPVDRFALLNVMIARSVRHISLWDAFAEAGNAKGHTEWYAEDWWKAMGKFIATP